MAYRPTCQRQPATLVPSVEGSMACARESGSI